MKTKLFKKEFIALCKKHNLVHIPTYEGKVSHHDPMYIVPLDENHLEFITDRLYFPNH